MTLEIQFQKLREEIDLILGYSKMATFQCPHCNEYSNTSRFEVMNHIKSDHQPQWVILTLFWVRPKNIWTFCFWLSFWKFIIISFFSDLPFNVKIVLKVLIRRLIWEFMSAKLIVSDEITKWKLCIREIPEKRLNKCVMAPARIIPHFVIKRNRNKSKCSTFWSTNTCTKMLKHLNYFMAKNISNFFLLYSFSYTNSISNLNAPRLHIWAWILRWNFF